MPRTSSAKVNVLCTREQVLGDLRSNAGPLTSKSVNRNGECSRSRPGTSALWVMRQMGSPISEQLPADLLGRSGEAELPKR